jgi:hypothetical protein
MTRRWSLLAALLVATVVLGAPGSQAVAATGPTIESARDALIVELPPVRLLDVAGTPSCDRAGRASISWKVTSAEGPLYEFGLTSPDALKTGR